METSVDWLLGGPPWVQYRTRLDLLNQPEDHPDVQAARQRMLAHPLVQGLITELVEWSPALTSHKSAGHPIHKLTFLADLGIRVDDPGMAAGIERILAHQSDTGPFQVLVQISPHFGGTGVETWSWALCDAPLVLYALAKMGMAEDSRVQKGVAYLISLVKEFGWTCTASPELGKFHGPGGKNVPCPYANLAMIKLLSLLPAWSSTSACRAGVEAQLALWEDRAVRHPYLFYMGNDFCKLKAPLVWYDIVHVTEVLTHFPWALEDPRLRSMLLIMTEKVNADGSFTPESVWTAWKDWDFGQKRAPSPWLTLLVHRILRRVP